MFRKKNKGITLVALVITIVILLILAGISISTLTNTGIFQKAKDAKKASENAEKEQRETLGEYEKELDQYLPAFTGKTVEEAIKHGRVLNVENNTELYDIYGNKIVVPAGFKVTNNAKTVYKGIVIEDATTNATSGSQFVWVPVGTIYTDENKTEDNTKKITLGRYSFDTTTGNEGSYSGDFVEEDRGNKTLSLKKYGNEIAKNLTNFKNSAIVNGGYYIGRYEARKNSSGTITEVETDKVWNNIFQPDAAKQAQDMYKEEHNFTSDLINSYAWDTAILFIQKCTTETNYANKTSLNIGKIAQNGTNDKTNYSGTPDVQCNIFDIASNVREWVTETSANSSYPCVFRGGCYGDGYACYRQY